MVKHPTPPPVFLLIDGHAILHRAFHALPPLMSPSGVLVNAVYGFATILLKALAEFAPSHVAVVFDAGGITFRHELFQKYQAQREEKPDDLYAQLDPIIAMLAAFRIPVFQQEGVEADDIIGTIVEQAASGTPQTVRQSTNRGRARKSGNVHVLVLTGDKDLLQLVRDGVEVVLFRRGVSDTARYDVAAVEERFGFPPTRVPDYKALAGDPSDNYPGVPGIGDKTATALVRAFGDVAHILRAARAKIPVPPLTGTLAAKLRDHAADAQLGLTLATIRRDLRVAFALDACARQSPDRAAVVALFRELGFLSLVGKIPGGVLDEAQQHVRAKTTGTHDVSTHFSQPATPEALTRLAADLSAADAFAFAIATDAGSPRIAHPRAVACAYGTHVAVGAPWGAALAAIAPAFRSTTHKVTHDKKAALHLLGRAHVSLAEPTDDTMLMSYLLAPGSRKHDLAHAAFQELGEELRLADDEGGREVPDHAAACVRAIASLAPILRRKLVVEQLERVYRTIDLPLVPVLQRMEWHGIRLDTDALAVLSRAMHEQLTDVDARIFAHATHPFAIDSPKQLKEVLFVELGIAVRGVKKTAKGKTLSTAAAELEKLRGAHPIIEDVLVHRELKKLVSTYVDALPVLVDRTTGRVHTTFNQTVTSTGRLSSDSPNLQNIPVAAPWGPAIRRAFVAEDGWTLLALDYSQFELRVAAALSGDRALTAAFRARADIHAATATEVFGITADAVTKDQRRVAKAINFGILYGMGPGTLSQTAGISRTEAEEYIHAYFAAYPQLHAWIEETKAIARSRGFVESLFGRKRYLPEMSSGVPMVRAAAERMAVNMPIQGTQADLMKMAMVQADAWITEANHSTTHRRAALSERIRMLLTVHDELVFEVRSEFVHEAAVALRTILEGVHTFSVPMVVTASAGRSWGELTPLAS